MEEVAVVVVAVVAEVVVAVVVAVVEIVVEQQRGVGEEEQDRQVLGECG